MSESGRDRPHYPKPDRSRFDPSAGRDPDISEGERGAFEGVLADGRPFRAEGWYMDGLTLLTYFFSVVDIENSTPDQLMEILAPGLEEARVPLQRRRIAADAVRTINDDSGNAMYSITFVVGLPE